MYGFTAQVVVFAAQAHTLEGLGGDLVSTWVANLRVHAEGQATSQIHL